MTTNITDILKDLTLLDKTKNFLKRKMDYGNNRVLIHLQIINELIKKNKGSFYSYEFFRKGDFSKNRGFIILGEFVNADIIGKKPSEDKMLKTIYFPVHNYEQDTTNVELAIKFCNLLIKEKEERETEEL